MRLPPVAEMRRSEPSCRTSSSSAAHAGMNTCQDEAPPGEHKWRETPVSGTQGAQITMHIGTCRACQWQPGRERAGR